MRGKVKKLSLFAKAALALICLIVVTPIIIYLHPRLVGADGSYTVMSGSMSPALKPGDLVIVENTEPSAIDVGDVVTVESEDFTYTHRVVEVLDGDRFRLKGDANEDPDQGLVEASQIVGRVALIFPFSHLYNPYGFAAALLVPAAMIIGNQMRIIYQHTKRRNKRETMMWRRKRQSVLDTGTLLLALILTVSTTRIIAPHFIGGSSSYFYDKENSEGLFSADIWTVPSTITCDVSTPQITLLESVTISGIIDPAPSALVDVTIEYLTEGVWIDLYTTEAMDGIYSYNWTPTVDGSYDIRASWDGEGSYDGSTSEPVDLTVNP